jgi:uncharacterized protein
MLGRLARYLRMMGCDTAYVRGVTDDEVLRRARAEGRVVLTRDRALARRGDPVILLTSVDLAGQLRQVAAALPGVPRTVSFERCTICNGTLERRAEAAGDPSTSPAANAAPSHVREWFECRVCGHRYWEGSHTVAVRDHLAEWIGGSTP